MNHCSFVVRHTLHAELRFASALEFLKAHVERLVRYLLVKNRVAVLENTDRYTQLKLWYSRPLLLFLWQF